jgi:hypothetical protein
MMLAGDRYAVPAPLGSEQGNDLYCEDPAAEVVDAGPEDARMQEIPGVPMGAALDQEEPE